MGGGLAEGHWAAIVLRERISVDPFLGCERGIVLVCTHIRTHTHTHMHAYTYAHIHTYTNTDTVQNRAFQLQCLSHSEGRDG